MVKAVRRMLSLVLSIAAVSTLLSGMMVFAEQTTKTLPSTPVFVGGVDQGYTGQAFTYLGAGNVTVPANYSGTYLDGTPLPLTTANVLRSGTNFGNISGGSFYVRVDGDGKSGYSTYVYSKFDLREIANNVKSATVKAKIMVAEFIAPDLGVTTSTTNSNPVYIDVWQVPETKWITGVGSTTTPFTAVQGDGMVYASSTFQTNIDNINGPITNATGPDSALVQQDATVTDKMVKRIATITVPVGNQAASTEYSADVTKYIADRKADGFDTATLRFSVRSNMYGISGTSFKIRVERDTNPISLDVVDSTDQTVTSNNSKLGYLTLNSGSSERIIKTAGFDPAVLDQDINILTSDLIAGQLILNTFAADGFAGISVNGSVQTTGEQLAVPITPSAGTAAAQVTVTAQNGATSTYNLNFNMADYAPSTDSSLNTVHYTHSSVGSKMLDGVQGTVQNVELPYGASADIPVIDSAEPTDPFAVIESITQAASFPGSASIVCRAEDGSTTTYTINFTVAAAPPVVDHLPGEVRNVLSRYLSASSVLGQPTFNASVYAVEGSEAVPAANYADDSLMTNDEKILAAIAGPYNTTNPKAWIYGDRPASGGTNPIYKYSTNVIVEGTSPLFLGDNVTKIINLFSLTGTSVAIPDMYSFDIDKPATVYIVSSTVVSSNLEDNGWRRESGLKAFRGNTTTLTYSISGKTYAVPKGTNVLDAAYSKHYAGGQNVEIPSRGETAGNGFAIFVVWDGCSSLATLSDTKVNGVSITNFSPNTTTYDVLLPYGTTQIPTLDATPSVSAASVQIINPVSLPGYATVNITAGDGVSTQTYTINYGIDEPQAPPAPSVTADDVSNTIVNMDLETMEYAISKDGGLNFTDYSSESLPVLGGSKKVKVRFKAQGSIPASEEIILTFTYNAGDVSGDGVVDISDVIMTAEIAVGSTEYTAEQGIAANVSDKSDMTVDISDVVLIAERAVGGTEVFPVDIVQPN